MSVTVTSRTQTPDSGLIRLFLDALQDKEQIVHSSDPSELGAIIRDLCQEIQSRPLRVYQVESLLHHLGVAIGAITQYMLIHRYFYWDKYSYTESFVEAGTILLVFGDLSRQFDKKWSETDDARDEVFEKAHDLVISSLVSKTFLVIDSRDSEITTPSNFRCYFLSHPLLALLVKWLSAKENQTGNSREIDQIKSFLALMSNLMANQEFALKQDAEFRTNLAKATVYAFHEDGRNKMAGVSRNLVKANLIEAVPFLVYELWGDGRQMEWLETSEDDYAVRYQRLKDRVMYPVLTHCDDLMNILDLPVGFLPVHLSLLCQLWPKWRQVRLELARKSA